LYGYGRVGIGGRHAGGRTNRSQLVQLSEAGRFWHLDFDELSPAEQTFRAIWELEGEVNAGGFDQYLFNSSGDTAFAIVEALQAIRADSAARMAAAANALFLGSSPPRDAPQDSHFLPSSGLSGESRWRGLTQEFLLYPDSLTDL
jgi:hypothetical protein